MLQSVAAIFRATCPDLPTPITTMLPPCPAISFTAAARLPSSFSAALAMACDSTRMASRAASSQMDSRPSELMISSVVCADIFSCCDDFRGPQNRERSNRDVLFGRSDGLWFQPAIRPGR